MSTTDRRTFVAGLGAAALLGTMGGCSSTPSRGAALERIPRIRLTSLPTACNPMTNLSRSLGGPDLYIKRDDVMELAHGGNKTRKLEYALAQALDRDARAVVTQGGLQSNHVRQTCSGAARVGLEAHVVLSNPVPEMRDALMGSGNYLMDRLMGARIYFAEDGRAPVVEKVTADLSRAGKKPYNIPAGASNGIGSLGYVNAAQELMIQWDAMGIRPSHVFTATGSCGTQGGLLMGLRYFGNTTTQVVGISVSGAREATRKRLGSVLDMVAGEMGVARSLVGDADLIVYDEYIGEGYGRPTPAGVEAMKTVAAQEGIILDPVYTGKGMSAMLDMIENRKLRNARDVVFLHTGGAPAIHPYADHLFSSS